MISAEWRQRGVWLWHSDQDYQTPVGNPREG